MRGRLRPLLAGAALAVALSSTACYRMQYFDAALDPAPESVERWNHFGLYGLLGDPVVPLYDLCPDGVAQVDVWHSPANVVVSILLLGLYTPSTTEVWCVAEAPPDPSDDTTPGPGL